MGESIFWVHISICRVMCVRHFQETWQRALSSGLPSGKRVHRRLLKISETNSPQMVDCVKNQRFIYLLRHAANLPGSVSDNPIDSSTMRKINWKNRDDGTGPFYSGTHAGGDFRLSHYLGFSTAHKLLMAGLLAKRVNQKICFLSYAISG